MEKWKADILDNLYPLLSKPYQVRVLPSDHLHEIVLEFTDPVTNHWTEFSLRVQGGFNEPQWVVLAAQRFAKFAGEFFND